jgi:hypothetical protein
MTDLIEALLTLALTVAGKMFNAVVYTATAIYTAQYTGVL